MICLLWKGLFSFLKYFFFFYCFSVAKRPPVQETANFLQSLLANHGPNYLEKLFGSKARDALAPLGGVQKVAVTLSGEYLDDVFIGDWSGVFCSLWRLM